MTLRGNRIVRRYEDTSSRHQDFVFPLFKIINMLSSSPYGEGFQAWYLLVRSHVKDVRKYVDQVHFTFFSSAALNEPSYLTRFAILTLSLTECRHYTVPDQVHTPCQLPPTW